MRQACWYEEIFVVQKPTIKGTFKGSDVTLHIDYKGKNKVEGNGTIYKQNPLEKC